MIVDGSSTDRHEDCPRKGARVHLSPQGYGRAYRTGFEVAKGDIIVTMDADCTYPAEKVPELVAKLLNDDLEFITCDRLTLAEEGSMSGLHGLEIGCFRLTLECCSGTASRTPNRACGCSESASSRTKPCARPTTACRSRRKSKSSLGPRQEEGDRNFRAVPPACWGRRDSHVGRRMEEPEIPLCPPPWAAQDRDALGSKRGQHGFRRRDAQA